VIARRQHPTAGRPEQIQISIVNYLPDRKGRCEIHARDAYFNISPFNARDMMMLYSRQGESASRMKKSRS
jgi:hypothetical protein